MQWAHAVRLDLPEDADARTTRWVAATLEPMLASMEGHVLARATLAVSGAALRALARHGCAPVLEQIRRLAASRRLELASTAMHGALLPLLPAAEARRQVLLNDEENRRVFDEDVYRPATFWSPHLATTPQLERVVTGLQFTVMLVDERALPRWPWPADRLATSAALPGLTLVPSAADACRLVRDGRGGLRELGALRGIDALDRTGAPTALVTACDVKPRTTHFHGFLEAAHRDRDHGDRLVRLVEVVERLPASEAVHAQACAAPTTNEALSDGRPFAPWFRPGDALNGRMWRLATLAAEAWAAIDAVDLEALPEARALRFALDRSWRAEHFVRGADARRWLDGLAAPLAGVSRWLPPGRVEELDGLVADIRQFERHAPPTGYATHADAESRPTPG